MEAILIATGIIIGLILACLVFLSVAFLRSPLERLAARAARMASEAGPRTRGGIVEPESEGDLVRQNVMERNEELGKDTTIRDFDQDL